MCSIGDVVKYKDDFWLVLGTKFDGKMLRIIAPHQGNGKLEIASRNAQPTGLKVTPVTFKNKPVLVTKRGMIISLISERLLRNDTADGKAILKQAGL